MRVREFPAAVVAVATAIGLAACSSSSSPAPTSAAATTAASSSPASSSSAAPTSAAPTTAAPSSTGALSAAAQRFVSLAAPADAALAGFLALPASAPLTTVHAAAVKASEAETRLAQQLRTGPWPAAATGAVDTLSGAISKESFVYQQASMAPTIAAIKQVLVAGKAAIAARVAAAAAARAALGLPAAPSSPAPG